MEKVDLQNLRDLTAHSGWGVLKKELSDELVQIQDQINKVDDGENNVIKYNENDLLKRVRKIYMTLLETPEDLIEAFWVEENNLED